MPLFAARFIEEVTPELATRAKLNKITFDTTSKFQKVQVPIRYEGVDAGVMRWLLTRTHAHTHTDC